MRAPIDSVLTVAVVALLAGMTSGCATITGGTSTNLSIETEPEDATARVGTSQCETPCQMAVSRDAARIHIEKEGYQPLDLALEKEFRAVPTILGNILWLVPGLAVDFVVGGAYDIRPVNVELEAEDGDGGTLRLELQPKETPAPSKSGGDSP